MFGVCCLVGGLFLFLTFWFCYSFIVLLLFGVLVVGCVVFFYFGLGTVLCLVLCVVCLVVWFGVLF